MTPFLGVAGLGGAGSLLASSNPIPETKWWLTYGGYNNKFGLALHRDSSGNLYTMCNTSSFGAGVYSHLVVKFDSEGVKQWDTCLGTNGQDYTGDYTKSVSADSSGNVYACGQTNGYGNPRRLLFYKLNSSGTLQWTKTTYQGSYHVDSDVGTECDNNGNPHVFGGAGGGGFIHKFDSSGNHQWQRTTGADHYWNAKFDSSNNMYLTGQNDNYYHMVISKVDSSGNFVWSRKLSQSSVWIGGRGIDLDSSGNIYVCGNFRPTGGGNPNGMFIVKYDNSGTLQWQRIISNSNNEDNAQGLAVAADKIYINGSAGATGSYTPGFMAQYDTSGNIQWQRTFTLNGGAASGKYMNPSGIAASNTGYVFPQYYQTFQSSGGYDGFIGKFPADGSDTGTYGNFVYAASSVPESAGSFSSSNFTPSIGSSGFTVTNAGVTNYYSNVTSNLNYY